MSHENGNAVRGLPVPGRYVYEVEGRDGAVRRIESTVAAGGPNSVTDDRVHDGSGLVVTFVAADAFVRRARADVHEEGEIVQSGTFDPLGLPVVPIDFEEGVRWEWAGQLNGTGAREEMTVAGEVLRRSAYSIADRDIATWVVRTVIETESFGPDGTSVTTTAIDTTAWSEEWRVPVESSRQTSSATTIDALDRRETDEYHFSMRLVAAHVP